MTKKQPHASSSSNQEPNHDEFESGLRKEHTKKPRLDLLPYELIERIAGRFMFGAEKYGEDNWKLATNEEAKLFKQAAMRHLFQWAHGDDDEDHASAAITDIIMYEWLINHRK